ncbi:hypothetical protein E4U53_007800, partial [Claviceps sorghi]
MQFMHSASAQTERGRIPGLFLPCGLTSSLLLRPVIGPPASLSASNSTAHLELLRGFPNKVRQRALRHEQQSRFHAPDSRAIPYDSATDSTAREIEAHVGNGVGGMEIPTGMHPSGPNQPQATEYTLQGVMRFLQTEWHRHERDRNSWEIEKQEMRGRIANLEGQARRADATQKALKKYVTILERKVKDQAEQIRGPAAKEEHIAAKNDRAAKIQEKLR